MTRLLRVVTVIGVLVALIGVLVPLVVSVSAQADPAATDWERLRQCESSGRYGAVSDNGHYGAYQFDVATWQSVGGTGLPSAASPPEQDHRALSLYRMRGWQPWECATILGLSEDADAATRRVPSRVESVYMASRSGSTSAPAPGPVTGDAAAGTAPAWPGTYVLGDCDPGLRVWQLQMNRFGYAFQGTGCYGERTQGAVLDLQRANGLTPSGLLGPKTWEAAWTGTSPTGAPRWPGRVYRFGDCDPSLRDWQLQMNRYAYDFKGTGCYGDTTRRAALALQLGNELNPSGLLGPKTWLAAWAGRPPLEAVPAPETTPPVTTPPATTPPVTTPPVTTPPATPPPVTTPPVTTPPATTPPVTTPPVTTPPATTPPVTTPPATTPPVTTPPATPLPGSPVVTGTEAAVLRSWGPVVAGDEFNYVGSPDPGKWSAYNGPGHAGQGLRRPSAFQVDGNKLIVTGDEAGTTGGMAARFDRRLFGRWESRMRVPPGDSQYHPVLILWPDSENFPCDGEVDYAETTAASDGIDFFLHYSCSNRQTFARTSVDLAQWHNYAVEWTPSCITGFIDGAEWFRDCTATHVPRTPMHQTVQLDYFPNGSSGVKRSTMEVDWVRTYDL